MLSDAIRCLQMPAVSDYIRTPETWALSVAGASLDSLRGTYRGEQQFGNIVGYLYPAPGVLMDISQDILFSGFRRKQHGYSQHSLLQLGWSQRTQRLHIENSDANWAYSIAYR